MAIITGIALESNKKFRVNFDGGNLSSDGGLLLLKEFYHKLGVNSLLRNSFHTTDSASFRIHKDYQNLLLQFSTQMRICRFVFLSNS